ncbi:DUF58 domain-containing protein [bacterium]|nr:DUF58 domain-containing protein [bacterium]
MTSRLTINAWVFIFLTVFTIIVAGIFHTPLLVYTAVFLVSTNLVLFVWSFHAVRGLKVKRYPPSFGVAGQPMEVGLELTNERSTARYGTLGFDLHEQLTPGKEYSPVAFLVAPAGSPVRSSYTITPPRRGVFRIGPLFLWGGDPFGFYKNWRKVEIYNSVLVLPRALDFKMAQPPSISSLSRDESGSIPVGGQSTEFLGVREYVPGQQLKHIHWRTSARQGKLISRQYELNVAASVSVLLLVDENMRAGSGADTPLEYAITMAASLGSATGTSRFQFNMLTLGARPVPLVLHSDGSVEQYGTTGTKSDGFSLEFLSRELWGRDAQERRRRSPDSSNMPYDSLAGSGKRFYQEMAIRLARLGEYGPTDWELANRLIVHYLPQGSSLVVLTCDPSVEAWERLGLMGMRYRGITVVNFDKASFEKARGSWGDQPARSESKSRYRPGYNVIDVHYKDDLPRVLSEVFNRAISASHSRGGAVASSSKMLSSEALLPEDGIGIETEAEA